MPGLSNANDKQCRCRQMPRLNFLTTMLNIMMLDTNFEMTDGRRRSRPKVIPRATMVNAQ